MHSRMIRALYLELDKTLYSHSRTRFDLAHALDVSPSTITRRLDSPRLPEGKPSRLHATPLDDLVDTVATLAGVSPFSIWEAAFQLYAEHRDDSDGAWDDFVTGEMLQSIRFARQRLAARSHVEI